MRERNPRKAKRPETPDGSYSALPHVVMDSVAYKRISFPAQALLNWLLRQHNGSNNGHLQMSAAWLAGRGFGRSNSVLTRAKNGLINVGLIVETRRGGFHGGPSLYALTWLPISNFIGLDILPSDFRRGLYAALNESLRANTPQGGATRTATRGGAVPAQGAMLVQPAPEEGTYQRGLTAHTAPPEGDNASNASATEPKPALLKLRLVR